MASNRKLFPSFGRDIIGTAAAGQSRGVSFSWLEWPKDHWLHNHAYTLEAFKG
jgi:hypothetical protein